jgi:hypothetical protein
MNKSRVPSLLFSVLLILSVLSGLTSRAQKAATNTAVLQKASQDRTTQNAALQQLLTRTALQKGWPLTLRDKRGRLAYLRGINSAGFPYYVTTVDNIISAATIRTNQLWPGGKTGLALNGSSANMKGKIAVWDEGLVRPTHVELIGRVTQVDKSPTLSDHSTHVSGTMIAAGVNPVAKGMSYGAQLLQAYDFNNDAAEMMKAAAAGLLVSNHSYADIAGWYLDAAANNRWEFWGAPGDTVDISFGLYDQNAQLWDSISYNAPYYLIAKAAGNNPGDTGPAVGGDYWRMNSRNIFIDAGPRPAGISSNAGYNTIATYGCSKNILTIGAVNPIPGGYSSPSDVVAASFTSLGPTGDGRIKPDLVADGVNVLSSISTADNAYDIFSGTSMATPASAGSSFLLQEYYSKLHSGTFMRSATLKGLLIHTADEAGAAPGPDYVFGWGLIDMARAASVITSDNTDHSQVIKESSLTNGTKDNETFTVTASGKTAVTATICWTDPPGVPVNIPSNESNFADVGIKLINDLDLRIKDNTTGTVYMPWVLNPAQKGAAAIKGDNIRDNVEKVELNDSLIPGRTYTITVSHKGTLQRGTQLYSILISGGGGAAVCTSASTAGGASIDNVVVSNLSNPIPAGACRSYTDFTTVAAAKLPVGQNVPITITSTSCNSTTNNRVISVYIDFNNDGTFESNELAYQSLSVAPGTFNGSIAVPTTAVTGTFARMRIIAEETATPGAVTPCGTYGAGETQDYRVTFTNPATDVGIIDLEYPNQTTCSSDSQLVAVRIHNYGTTAQTGGVPVSTVVTLSGTTVATLSAICKDSIPAGGEVVYTYSASLPTIAGDSYTFVSQTALSGDVNTANDQNTTTVTVNAGASSIAGSATVCGNNATTVQLKANATGDDVPLWYDSQTATTPIAAGSNTTTTDILKTYYVALNDLTTKGGAPNKEVYAPATGSPGFYYPMNGQFMSLSTSVPLTLESAKLYVGHSGQITFTLATLYSIDPNNGYSYIPLTSTTIDVYATKQVPQSGRVNVNAGDNTDTGGIFYLNIPIPTPGNYILIAQCSDSTNLFLNSGITTNHYPVSIPGVFAVTGNSNKYDPNNAADSVTYFQKYYFPLYDIGIRLDACPGPRTAVTPATSAAPVITLAGDILTSSADSGNQWYVSDTVLAGSTGVTDTAKFPGLYYTVVTDPVTGCVLTSNKVSFTPGGSNPIGLSVSPNPSTGVFQLQFFMTTANNTSIELYDALGQRVYEADYPNFSGLFSEQINTGYLASGMYVLRIVHGGSTYHTKLIVKKN